MKFAPGVAVLTVALVVSGQSPSSAQAGMVERVKVHGKALEGNLAGDSADRDVSIYLPASYKKAKSRRYPVIYFLHGFTDSDDKWFGMTEKKHWINLPAVLDKAMAQPGAQEMIVVMPNAFTRYQGSMYSSSATTGNWEEFVSKELVAYVDGHYRTLAQTQSRALAGHSMGGYGTIRIGMKHPEVFSSLYLLSPCCMAPPNLQQGSYLARAEAVKEPTDIEKTDFFTKAMLASAAAWSPDPKSPPLFLALPSKDGQFQPTIAAKWAANAPLAVVDQYIANLRLLKGIGMDAGTKDEPIASTTRTLDRVLNDYQIAHEFEIYEGDHLNRIAERIETKVIPLFSKTLASQKTRGAK